MCLEARHTRKAHHGRRRGASARDGEAAEAHRLLPMDHRDEPRTPALLAATDGVGAADLQHPFLLEGSATVIAPVFARWARPDRLRPEMVHRFCPTLPLCGRRYGVT